MSVFIIDNYDSFTFNLVHYIEQFTDVKVVRYNKVNPDEIEDFDRLIISPGPGLPTDYPLLFEIIERYYQTKKILGVCLGHEAIGMCFGAEIGPLENVLHGVGIETEITNSDNALFKNLPSILKTGRYHSWKLQSQTLSEDIKIIANDEMNTVAAIKHKDYPLYGVQFHPESILTEFGFQMIKNWIKE